MTVKTNHDQLDIKEDSLKLFSHIMMRQSGETFKKIIAN